MKRFHCYYLVNTISESSTSLVTCFHVATKDVAPTSETINYLTIYLRHEP